MYSPLSFTVLSLSLTLATATLLPAAPISLNRRQLSLAGGWALRAETCPELSRSCKTAITFPGQDACCPSDMKCAAGSDTGDIMCCPSGDDYCGGDVGHPFPAPLCADPTWTLWASRYSLKYFCCAKGLTGYTNGESLGFGELCAEAGLTSETSESEGGSDTLVASTAATSTYTFKKSAATATTTGSAKSTSAAQTTGTAPAPTSTASNLDSNTHTNQTTTNSAGRSVVLGTGCSVGVMVGSLLAYFMVV